ncbi:cytochrome P450 [Rhizodiscina lignyota]|uniref:Cytochrome P450 n=1 Tax=Rhizodiscina lignyota TaxID=1504668 RepID=A0A9P4IMG2_9PEZI|nr:cytochrome P450 [Rhizodiscina lignyota]
MDTSNSKFTIYILFSLLIIFVLYIASNIARNLPNGPPGLPIFGNIFDFRGSLLHVKLTEWSQQYGDVFAYKMGQSSVIVLNSPESFNDLFIKKGQKYSSRPRASNQATLITEGARIVNMQYGDLWREHRKIIHGFLGMQNAKIFLPYQEYESRRTLKHLLDEPDAFFQEVARYSGSVTFSMLMGCRFDRSDAFIPQQIGKKMQNFFTHIRPGAWLVDWIPILDYLPDALAPWRKQAVEIRRQIMPFYLVFYEQMKERVRNGTAPDCFVARVLQNEGTKLSETEYAHLIAELITAGTETTATTLQWFFKAAVLFPEQMKHAQKEIDRVVGRNRLPNWEDREKLPYLNAVINELHRWATATPLAFIHATSEADVYRGKSIPKGATVIPNVNAIHKNSQYYPEPDKFMPERFLDPRDPRSSPGASPGGQHFAFGVGRRECPGRHVADASLYIVMSRILWAFDITPKPNSPPPDGYSGAFPVFGPAVFQCAVKPRNEAAAQMIRERAEVDRPKEMEDSSIYDELLAKIQ